MKKLIVLALVFPWLTLATVIGLSCKNTALVGAVAEGGAPLVQCVTTELLKGDDTFEGIAAACGGAAVSEVVGIIETLASSYADGGLAKASPLAAKAAAAHHRNAGK